MPRLNKVQTKSSLTIAAVVHGVAIFVIFFWAAKTGRLPGPLRELVAVIIPPAQKELPPPKPALPEETRTAEPAEPSPASETPPPPPPESAPLTASKANPNAPPGRGSSPFTAEARQPGAAPPPLVQGQTTAGARTSGPRPETRRPSPTAALESARPSTIAQVFQERQKSVTVSDAIGSEQISKASTSDAGEIVAKVTGTSVVEGKHVVVRGLSDRYTRTTLNGAEIPTADPYRSSVQLDLIPAPLIDKIVVYKTITPDQPGGFTGGAIDVVTKSFPAKTTFSLSGGVSYNTQSNLRDDFLSYKGGSDDWLAMDDGSRSLPGIFEGGSADIPEPIRRVRTPEDQRKIELLDEMTRSFHSKTFYPSRRESPLNHSCGRVRRHGPVSWETARDYGRAQLPA